MRLHSSPYSGVWYVAFYCEPAYQTKKREGHQLEDTLVGTLDTILLDNDDWDRFVVTADENLSAAAITVCRTVNDFDNLSEFPRKYLKLSHRETVELLSWEVPLLERNTEHRLSRLGIAPGARDSSTVVFRARPRAAALVDNIWAPPEAGHATTDTFLSEDQLFQFVLDYDQSLPKEQQGEKQVAADTDRASPIRETEPPTKQTEVVGEDAQDVNNRMGRSFARSFTMTPAAIVHLSRVSQGHPNVVMPLLSAAKYRARSEDREAVTATLINKAVDVLQIAARTCVNRRHAGSSTVITFEAQDLSRQPDDEESVPDDAEDRPTDRLEIVEAHEIVDEGETDDFENFGQDREEWTATTEILEAPPATRDDGVNDTEDETTDFEEGEFFAEGEEADTIVASKPAKRAVSEENQQMAKIDSISNAKPVNRTEALNKVLKVLQSGSPDVEAAALISEDGLMIASALPQDLDETRVAGMSATILSLGSRASSELGRGDIEEVVVRGENGYAVMVSGGRGVLLLVVTNENAKLGLVFFDMREAVGAINRIL